MTPIMDDVALLSTLGVAFLLGMRHALDADHVAAVATFTGRREGLRQALRDGLSWGAGHAATVAVIGGLPGLAGSAAVVLLVLTTIPTILVGCLYLGLFGLGSMVGMALVSLLLGAPLAIARKRGDWLQRGLTVVAGLASILIGLTVVVRMVRSGVLF